MVNQFVCPDGTQLRKLVAGELLVPELDTLVGHLEGCPSCLARVQTLAPVDTLEKTLSKTRVEPPGPDDAVVARLMAKLKSLPVAAPPIAFACSACKKALKVKAELAGKKVKCPGCGQATSVPTPAAPPAPPAPDHTVGLPGSDTAGVSSTDDRTAAEKPAVDAEAWDFLAPSQAGDEIGRLGSYRVLKVLGRGGMGVVFRAEDLSLKRVVALKAMLPTLAASPSAKKRFIREAQTAASIKHDHIVTIHQVGEDRGAPFLAMEFLHGEPLDVRLKREGRLPLHDVLRLGREVAEGLAAAHEAGLIHRDIKPANIWLETRPSGASRVKILDFGLARSMDDQAGITQAGAIVGTPAYMAPEQAQGADVDQRCDLFSLGVMLYVMSTGQQPFRGKDTMSTLMAVAMDTAPAPRALNPDVPAELSDYILRLLAKKPDDRPGTAAEVAKVLHGMEFRPQIVAPAAVGVPVAIPMEPTAPTESMSQLEFDLDAPTVPATARKPAATKTKPRRPVWVAVAVGLLVLALGAAAAQLIFTTKDGTLYVEVDDGEADVRFRKGKLEIYDEKGELKYTLEPSDKNKAVAPGKYLVKVTGADGVKLETETFEMDRKGKAFVRVKAGGPAQVAGKGPVNPAAPSGGGLRVDQQAGGPQAIAAEVPELKVPGDGPFTVEGWVKIDRPAHGENPHFFGWTYQFVVGSNGLGIGASQFADDGKGGWTQHPIHAADTLERGKWQHLAAVRDGKQNRLYINGALVAKGDVAGPIHTARTDPLEGVFAIGQVCDGVAFREVRVSKVARYAGEKSFSPADRFETDKDTLALYHLDDGKGGVIADASGKHHGKVANGTWGPVPPVVPGTPGTGLLLFASETGAEAPAPALDTRKPWTAEAYLTPLTEHMAKNSCGVLGCDQGFGIGVKDGKYFVYSSHGETIAGVVTAGERVHIACVQTDAKRMLFLNGKLAASTDNRFPDANLPPGKLQFSLVNHVPNQPPIDVLVEGVRVSQVVRYTKDFTPPGRHTPDKETLALYHCDEGQGDKLTDSSGNNLHGKIVNAKWGKATSVTLPPSVPGTPLALRKPTWKPGPADNILPGLVARPAILDGVVRWQIVPTATPVPVLAFSPDGKWVATADAHYVRFYDAVTGELKALGHRTQHAGANPGLDWSADSKWVRVADFRAAGFDHCHLFATDGTHSPVPWIQHADVDYGWNPKYPVLACMFHGVRDRIQLLDPNQEKPVVVMTNHEQGGKAVWSPDGETLLVVREDKTAQLFDRTGKPGAKLTGVVDPAVPPAWSAESKQIAAMASATEVGFWKADGTAGAKTGKHEKAVLGFHWKPDGKLLAVSDAEGKRHFWKPDGTSEGVVDPKDATPGFAWAKDGKGFFTPGKFWPAVGNPSFTNLRPPGMGEIVSPDQTSVAQVKRGEIVIAEWKDGEAKDIGWKVLQTRDGSPWWSADGQRLAVVDQNGVSLYDARDPKKVVRLGGGAGVNGLNRAAFSPRGDRLAVANDIGHLILCEPTGKPLRALTVPAKIGFTLADAVHDLQWHPDGKLLVATTGAATVTVFDTETGKVEASTIVAKDPNSRPGGSAIFSPANPDHLLIAHPDAAALWRWKVEKEPLQKFPGLGKLVPSPDGKRVLSLQAGGGIHGSDFFSAVLLSPDLKDRDTAGTKEYVSLINHPGPSLAWHPDGKHLVVTRLTHGSNAITIRSLDGKVVEEIKPDGIDVTWLEWVAPATKQNVLVGRIGQGPDICLVDLSTKKVTAFGKVTGEPTVSPDGKHLIAMEGSALTYWNLDTKAVDQKVVLLPNGEFVTLSPAGEVLEASANAGNYYRYLVEDKAGKLLLKTPAEIAPSLPKSEVAPVAGGVLRFAEATATSGVTVPTLSIPDKGPFTMEGYVTMKGDQGYAEHRVLFGREYQFALNGHVGGEIALFDLWSGGGGVYENATADKLPNPTKRFHVACVRTDTEHLLFVDGKQVAKSKALATGRGGFDIGLKVAADFSEIRVSSVARYKDDFVPAARFTPDKDTVALFHCDDGEGDKLTDSSGNGHHGKIVGGTWVRAVGFAPLDPAWLKAVAAMPPEKQVEAVHAELKKRNPEFVGTGEFNRHDITDGEVVGLELDGKVTDLSPVRALNGLKRLWVRRLVNLNAVAFPLTDLSPLRGMKLTQLEIPWAQVTDLSPLEGMPLERLHLQTTLVRDLTPLARLPLEFLMLGGTRVEDLTPLRGLTRLKYLNVIDTRVPDLKAVAGLQLDAVVTNKLISDLSPLNGMTLKRLESNGPITDLSVVKGMPLETLWLSKSKVTDLSPLIGMPLRDFEFDALNLERDGKTLRSLKSLEKINSKPAKEVLK